MARHLLLISIDTCRASHLSAYGYFRPTTPFLQQLAEDGVLFRNAFAQVPDTTPSHASLFTSRHPFVHAAANGVPLDTRLATLAEVLSRADFRTAAFVSGWTMTAEGSGLDRGFETYDDELTQIGNAIGTKPDERPAGETTARALEWLRGRGADDRLFLFAHYFDPHAVYAPPPPYDEMFTFSGEVPVPLVKIPRYARIPGQTDAAAYISRYDGEIRYVDDQIERLVAAFGDQGLLDDTLVIVTADHGESLIEHGYFFQHGFLLFEPSLHVPLVMSFPRRLPRGVDEASIAQTIDVMPTALDLLGLPLPGEVDGISLLPLMEGERSPRNSFAVAKTTKTLTYLNIGQETGFVDQWALRTPRLKYLENEDGGEAMLFDLERDPRELEDVAESQPGDVSRLAGLLAKIRAAAPETAAPEPLDAEERKRLEERLRSLGYVR